MMLKVVKILGLFLGAIIFCSTIEAKISKVLNVYCWSAYLPTSVLQQFTQETGIRINLSEYDSNETMYAKLKVNPSSGYDIVMPSNYYVQRMAREEMLHAIDKSKLPNLKNINPLLLHKEFDPQNDYSVPYLWGVTGIVVNSRYIESNKINSWHDFWEPEYKNKIMLLDDMRDVFSMGLLMLGYSINDSNPQHIQQAYLKLRALLPNIKLFNTDTEQTIYIDEDAIIGMGWNGDIYEAMRQNPAIKFIYPREGFVIWIDCFAIAKYAPHLENAYKFMNFIMRPDIALKISKTVGYTTPNLKAIKLLPKAMQNNQTFNPDAKTLKRGQVQTALDNKTFKLYAKYWEMLKIGE